MVKDQIALYFPKTQQWYFTLDNMSWNTDPNRQFTVTSTIKDEIPCPGDYFGDGWRPAGFSNGKFHIRGVGKAPWSATVAAADIAFPSGGKDKEDIPVSDNYEGDGTTRMAIFRPSEGKWYIKGTGLHDWQNTHSGNHVVQTGAKGDIPVQADYFGEGKPRIAVFRPGKHGHWFIKGPGFQDWGSSTGNHDLEFGKEGDIPVPADYNGDGKVDFAVFRPKEGKWFIKGSGLAGWAQSSGNVELSFGKKGDIPIAGDFYGEGKARLAVYRPDEGRLYIKGAGFQDESKSQGNLTLTFPEAQGIPLIRKYGFNNA
jgi:hypothetical protein